MLQAVELAGEWERQVSIDINDALQLLSASFTHPKIREAAVRSIAKADDQELLGLVPGPTQASSLVDLAFAISVLAAGPVAV